MTYVIQLIDDRSKVNSAFTKANSELLSRHADSFVNKYNKNKLLTELWLTDYKAILTKDTIIFDREKDMTMFLLRWS